MRLTDEQLQGILNQVKPVLTAAAAIPKASQVNFFFTPEINIDFPGVRSISLTFRIVDNWYKVNVSRSNDGTLEEVISGTISELMAT
ncbi:MAG: hypothetical protein QM757_26745 [Paludibaculum sp.]